MLQGVREIAAVVINDIKNMFETGISFESCERTLLPESLGADSVRETRNFVPWMGALLLPILSAAACLPRQLTALYSSTFTQQFDVPKLP